MTVHVEKLEAPATPLLPAVVLGFLSAMTALLMRWWRQPAPLVMSDDWLNERARSDSQQGWN
jgi:hypothetical protein